MSRVLGIIAALWFAGGSHAHAATVGVIDQTSESLTIRTGAYQFSYDQRGSWPLAFLRRTGAASALATGFLSVDAIQLLKPGNVHRVECHETTDEIRAVLSGSSDLAGFEIPVIFPKAFPGLVHYRVELDARQPITLDGGEPEWQFFGTTGTVTARFRDLFKTFPYLAQTSVYAPFAYYDDPDITRGRIYYFANYTAMNDYYKLAALEPIDAVSKFTEHRFGYTPPGNAHFQIPQGARLTLVDSYLYLDPAQAGPAAADARFFVDATAAVYGDLKALPTEFNDWRQVALDSMESLQDASCQTDAWGPKILKAYVNGPPKHADLASNLFVLTPFEKFSEVFGAGVPFRRQLEAGVDLFYVDQITSTGAGTFFDGVPAKNPDSHPESTWYYLYNILQIGKIAQQGNAHFRERFLSTIPYNIRFARFVNYRFPIVLDLLNLKPVDARIEGDVAGCYAYTMLQAYEMTRKPEYLDEAKRAAESLAEMGFRIGYEMHITASGIAACGWLHQVTGDRRYLELSYLPLANLLRDTWLWESDLGYAYGYRTFNNIAAQRGCPVVGPVEQNEAWSFLREYYLRTEPSLPANLRSMIPEFTKQMMASAWCSYPQTIPAAAVHPGPPYNPTKPELWIALEGIFPGLQKSGSIGQAVYMSGAAFRYAGDSYHRPTAKSGTGEPIEGRSGADETTIAKGLLVYCEYPLVGCDWEPGRRRLSFRTAGDSRHTCRIRVYYDPELHDLSRCTWTENGGPRFAVPSARDDFMAYCEVLGRGGTAYSVEPPVTQDAAQPETRHLPPPACAGLGITYLPQSLAYIRPGGVYDYTVILDNDATQTARVRIEAQVPHTWTARVDGGPELTVAPRQEQHVRVRVACPADTPVGEKIVELSAVVEGRKRPIVRQVYGVVRPDVNRGDDLKDAAGWKVDRPSTGVLLMSREVTLDLNDAGTVVVDTRPMDGLYLLTVSDATTNPPIRVISDATYYGVYLCDLKRITGWEGAHRFRFDLTSIGAKKQPEFGMFKFGSGEAGMTE
jgi:hypothetical protein